MICQSDPRFRSRQEQLTIAKVTKRSIWNPTSHTVIQLKSKSLPHQHYPNQTIQVPAASLSPMNDPRVTTRNPIRKITKHQARAKAINSKVVVAQEVPKAPIPKAAINRVVIRPPKEATRKESRHPIKRVIRVEADSNLEISKEKKVIFRRRLEVTTPTTVETKTRATRLPETTIQTEVVSRKIRVNKPTTPKTPRMDQNQVKEAKSKTMATKTAGILRVNTTAIRVTNQARRLINRQVTSLRLAKMLAVNNRTSRAQNMMGKHSNEYETI